MEPSARLAIDVFVPHVDRVFTIPVRGVGEVELRLVSAAPITLAPGDPRRDGGLDGIRSDPFTLLFRGPRQTPVPQGIHPFRLTGETVQEIFLVPVGFDNEGRLYEAVFN